MDVLVCNPGNGSLWLWDAYFVKTDGKEYVVGKSWDDGDVGSSYLPDDCGGESVTMNFPVSCVMKIKNQKGRNDEPQTD